MKEEESKGFTGDVYSSSAQINQPRSNPTQTSDGRQFDGSVKQQPMSDKESYESSEESSPLSPGDEAIGVVKDGDVIEGPNMNSSSADIEDESGLDSVVEIELELDKLLLGQNRPKKNQLATGNGTPKIGAAKAKRIKRAEKQAGLETEGKGTSKPRKTNKPFDPSAAIQKARGETVTTGKRISKK
jgi:hypothetical protein